jgi:hypothetical protein
MAAIDFPTSPTNGQTFTSGDKTWIYSTTISAWNLQAQAVTGPTGPTGITGATGPTGASGPLGIVSSATAPVSPSAGQVWFNTSTGASFIYYNSAWVELGGGSMSPLPVTSSTRPTSPWTGQTIYETDTNNLLIWNGTTWVGLSGPTATAGTNTTQLATTAFVTSANNLKANIASPTFTGTPFAPTASAGTNTTQIATTAFVNKAPRGIIVVTSSSSNTLTGSVVTGLTTTFTAVANRYYRISVLLLASMPVAGNRVIVSFTGASTRTADATAGVAGFPVLFGSSVQTYAAGSQTIQVSFTNIAGSNTINADAGSPHQLVIEDVGGV